MIGTEGQDVGFESNTGESGDWIPICQNLTDLSSDAEMRVVEEENIREVIESV